MEGKYGTTDSEMSNNNRISDKDLGMMIDSLCNQRLENPDVLLMDQIHQNPNRFKNAFEEEQYYSQKDSQEIEEGIISDIVSNMDSMSIEEINMIKSQGIYDRYIKQQKENGGPDIMASMEDELRNAMSTPLPGEVIVDVETSVASHSETTNDVRFQELPEITEETVTTEMEAVPVETSSEDRVMTDAEVEDMNDVPVADLEVSDNEITTKLKDTVGNISDEDAVKILSVMDRYKKGEKFNVYAELPNILKSEIDKAALEAGVLDPRLKNYFAKNFINEIVQDVYMTREIKNFEDELKGITDQMNNIPGMIIDNYSDEIREKFEDNMLSMADKIQEENPEKAEQLRRVASNFTATYTLSKIFESIEKNPSYVNRNYKQGRDSFTRMKRDFAERFSTVKPSVKPIESVYSTLRAFGYSDEYSKTVMSMVYSSIMSEVQDDSVESHVYAYYITLAFSNLLMTTNNSKTLMRLQSAVSELMVKIDDSMKALWDKKGGKKSKK